MKTIILFRHGKSDWNKIYGLDHDRPIAKRGINAAKLMGIYLREKKNIPDCVISSTALRAKSTAQLAIDSGDWNQELTLEKKLYGASPETIFEIIREQNNVYKSICLVGHEPSMSSFIYKYTNASYLRFPTATMARIDFETNDWKYLDKSLVTLCWIKRPKELY